jgi:hypothetical protein
VNRTRCPNLRLPLGFGNLVAVWVPLELGSAGGDDGGISGTLATGALRKGWRSISPYTLRGGLNRGAIRLGSGVDTDLVGTRDERVIPDAGRFKNLWRRF